MATVDAQAAAAALPATSRLTRVTQIALTINAVLHLIGVIGFFVELDPHFAQGPGLARRAAAAGVAGSIMMVVVARRLRQDRSLILMPIAFVLFNLLASGYDFLSSGNPKALAPAFFEALFLAVYSTFAIRAR